MADLNTLLADFAAGQSNKCWIIVQLEDFTGEEVTALLERTIADSSETDIVRIEAIKSAALRDDPRPAHNRYAMALTRVLENRYDDTLVRQFAARYLAYFVRSDSVVVSALRDRVLDLTDDINVRRFSIAALEYSVDCSICRAAIAKLVDVPLLGERARRALNSRTT